MKAVRKMPWHYEDYHCPQQGNYTEVCTEVRVGKNINLLLYKSSLHEGLATWAVYHGIGFGAQAQSPTNMPTHEAIREAFTYARSLTVAES